MECLPRNDSARVVKLVDTPDLGSGAVGIRVQVPSLAVYIEKGLEQRPNPFPTPCGNSSVVERDLAKVDVAGPTPVSRYIEFWESDTF